MPSSKHLKAPKIICNHLTIVSGPSSHKKDDKVKKFVISGPSSSKAKDEKVEKHKVEEHRRDKKAEKPKKEKKASRPSCWSTTRRNKQYVPPTPNSRC
jgi:hypothetical protein